MISPKEYDKIVKKNSPKSTIFKNCLMAFLIGGAICTVGQGLLELYQMWGLDEDTSKTLTSVTLIFFGILLTAIGVYDKIAKHAGAGTLVPITGFANAVSSPAIEFKAEGYVTGLGAKLFIIAGPVIVYGVSASIIYGAVLWILHMFGITLF
ncbi:stage V sporulation protein AC [Ruminococcus sp. YE282]|uniref:stage V sporulation protein AC n=1 Tax=Ruminococcus sp. YE282 TaxID=3158780 RepID=UPI0008824063|nr:stage V sporulation protein AC [Ruminococcus bromii]MEE3497617.1 stage V sporulation protein AC [Ruminococcus bromii]SCY13067.1 stage V sporulation protein AC [Ruminococcus bromii]HCB95913.1 stage V sporulation protein AC [Ruminococcus sp.]